MDGSMSPEAYKRFLEERERRQAIGTVNAVSAINPDDAAQARRDAQEFDVDFDTALSAKSEFASGREKARRDAMIEESPALPKLLSDAQIAALAQDSIENLRGIERDQEREKEERQSQGRQRLLAELLLLQRTGRHRGVEQRIAKLAGGAADATAAGFSTLIRGVTSGTLLERTTGNTETQDTFAPGFEAPDAQTQADVSIANAARAIGVPNIFAPEIANPLSQLGVDLNKYDENYRPAVEWEAVKGDPLVNFLPWVIETGLVSTPDLIAAMTALPLYVPARGGELARDRANNDGRAQLTAQDFIVSLPTATAVAVLDRIGGRGFLGFSDDVAKAADLPRAVGVATAKEAVTEAAQESLEQTAVTLGTETGFSLSQTGEAALQGLLAGGAIGGGIRAGAASAELSAQSERDVIEQDILEALTDAERLERLAEKVAESPLGQRDRDVAAQAVSEIYNQETRIIDADGLNTLNQLDEDGALLKHLDALGITEDQFESAVIRGEHIVVPLGTLAAQPEARQALADHIRTDEDSLTPAQAREQQAELDIDIEDAVAFYNEQQEALESFEIVARESAQQALDAGRPPKEAEAYAALQLAVFRRLEEGGDESAIDIWRRLNQRTLGPGEQTVTLEDGRTFTPSEIAALKETAGQTFGGNTPRPLTAFLRRRGLKPSPVFKGELDQIQLGDLIRSDGVDLDIAAELAAEAGYIGTDDNGKADVNELLEALDRDITAFRTGEGERVFSQQTIDFQKDVAARNEAKALLAEIRAAQKARKAAADTNTLEQATTFETPGSPEYQAAIAKGLDMSQEARLERAREMGFDTETVLYHGTGNLQNFDGGFDPSLTGKGNDQYGSGFYLTTNAAEASGYSTATLAGMKKLGGDSAPGVISAYVRMRNPIRLTLDTAASLDDAPIDLSPDQIKQMLLANPDLMDVDNSPLGDWHDIWSQGIQDWMIDDLAKQYAESPISHIEGDLFRDRSALFREQLAKVTGRDGVIMDLSTEEFGEKIHFIVWDPSNIRSINAAFDPDNSDSANLLAQSVALRSGDEALEVASDKRTPTTREVAVALEERTRQKHGTIKRGDHSKEASHRLSDWMVSEVLFEVEEAKRNPSKSAVGWYSEKFQNALDAYGELFPELLGEIDTSLPGVAKLKTQKAARDFFTALIAITSDGAKVKENFRYAVEAMQKFRDTGQIDSNVTFGGERNKSMRVNLQNIQDLLDRYGPEEMGEILLAKDTVSNLRKMAKESGQDFNTAYKANMELPYAALVFGPKLGAFYANLMGDTGYLTMDRWWTRTFNRMRGTLLTQPTEQGVKRLKGLVMKDRGLKRQPSTDRVLVYAAEYVASYKAKGYKNGTDVEKAANTVYKAAFEGLEDQPFNASDREFMINTTALAQEKLASQGIDLTIADIQAVLWYYEKRLYAELGARATADTSYEEIAKDIITNQRGLRREELESGELSLNPADHEGDGQGPSDDFKPETDRQSESLAQADRADGAKPLAQKARGTTKIPGGFGVGAILNDGETLVRLTEAANQTTLFHEAAHIYLELFQALETENEYAAEMMAKARKWLKVKDGEPLTRDQHERFAEQFEIYLMKGEAPSRELRDVFKDFARWFGEVYKRLRGKLKLEPEAKDFFDRMLASDAEIDAVNNEYIAKARRKFLQAGVFPNEEALARYERAARKAEQTAKSNLFERFVGDTRKMLKRNMRAERATIEADLRARYEITPEYSAASAIEPDMTEEQLYDIAINSGFPTVDHMNAAIDGLPDLDQRVKQEAEAEMVRRHGDAAKDGKAYEAAMIATLNENNLKTIEIMAEEMARLAARDPLDIRTIKAQARAIIETQPISEVIRPGTYALRAQQAHGRALKLAAKGRWIDALSASRHAVYNHEMARAAHKAQNEIDVANRFIKKFSPRVFPKKGVSEKKYRADFIEQMQALAALPGSANQQQKMENLQDFAVELSKEGQTVILPDAVYTSQPLPDLRDMSLQQLRNYKDSFTSFDHVARRLSEEKQAEWRADQEKRVAEVNDAWGDRSRNEWTRNKGLKQMMSQRLKDLESNIIRWPFFVKMLAGGLRGNLQEELELKLSKAESERNQRRNELTKRAVDILRKHKVYGELGNELSAPLIEANRPVRFSQVLAVAMNMGADSNIERLRNDPNLGDYDQLAQFIDQKLERRHWEAIQEIWDLIDSLRPEAFAVEKRMTGVTPKAVQRSMVRTRHGNYPGGYYPIKYDYTAKENRKIGEAAKEEEWLQLTAGIATRQNTKQGHLIERQSGVKRTVDLDLGVMFQHFDDVTNDIYMREPATQAMKILKDAEFVQAVEETHGTAVIPAMETILKRAVAGMPRDPDKAVQSLFRGARINASVAILGFNVPTAALAPISYFQTILPQYGHKVVISGLGDFFTNRSPRKSMEQIKKKSAFMRDREATIRREASEMYRRTFPDTKYEQVASGWQRVQGAGYWLMTVAELYTVSGPLWLGVYNDALSRGQSEDLAVSEADQAVRITQGSGNMLDQSLLQGGGEFGKALTLMYGYMSGAYGAVRSDVSTQKTAIRKTLKLAQYVLIMGTLAAFVEEIIRGGFDGEEDEAYLNRVIQRIFKNTIGLVPGAGEFFSSFDSGSQLQQSGKKAVRAAKTGQEATIQLFEQGYVEGETITKFGRQSFGAVGVAAGIPGTIQIDRAINTLTKDDDPTAFEIIMSGPDKDN